MTDSTTPPVGQDDADNDSGSGNWERRYTGLQKVLSARDQELANAKAEAQRLAQELEQSRVDASEFEAYRQAQAAAAHEAEERERFEALRAKFEPTPEPPTPLRHNEGSRVWAGPNYPARAKAADKPVRGFPV